jgi:hypothetical protein
LVEQVSEYQAIVDAEWQIIFNKLEAIYKTGAKVVLSKLLDTDFRIVLLTLKFQLNVQAHDTRVLEVFGLLLDAVLSLDQDDLNERLIGVKKVTGGGLQDSLFVDHLVSLGSKIATTG